ncbi:hypothetical protein IOQ59_00980 [Pontibacterium sp. N1Y112]|uniref:Uncharacterized protein n=1 Tax=Pontibacterium sinense TaxID=2781979 RepID=A0A8J7K4P1_9GAMM|nr:hypothetical protein [Pontibacterium sinense]MBE9395825.1 hypothetical protein [Pontibacterium sinense]
MLSTPKSLSELLHILNEATEKEQFHHLPQGTHLYHCGIYSNAASIWCANRSRLAEQPGRFEITASITEELLLININDCQWRELRHQVELDNISTLPALEQLCQLFNTHDIQLPESLHGLEWQSADITDDDAYLLLFHPLRSLQLFDIHDRQS